MGKNAVINYNKKNYENISLTFSKNDFSDFSGFQSLNAFNDFSLGGVKSLTTNENVGEITGFGGIFT